MVRLAPSARQGATLLVSQVPRSLPNRLVGRNISFSYNTDLISGGSDYVGSSIGGIYGQSWGFGASGQPDTIARAHVVNSARGIKTIDDIYQNILLRQPRPDELFNNQNTIVNGGSFQDVVYELAHSAEARGLIANEFLQVLGRVAPQAAIDERVANLEGHGSLPSIKWDDAHGAEAAQDIQRAFQTELGRSIDASGITNEQNYLGGSGGSLANIRTSVATSAEATQDVQAIFQNVLSRSIDANGIAAEEAYLAGGGSMAAIRTSVATSPEAAQDLQAVFQSILGRPIDANGIAAGEGYLVGGGSMAAYRTSIATSAEATQGLQAVFQDILGRPIDAGGIAAAQSYLAGGGSMAAFRTSVATSTEATQDVQTIFQNELGRTINATDIATEENYLANGGSMAAIRSSAAYSPEAQNDIVKIGREIIGIDIGSDPSQMARYQGILAHGSLDDVRVAFATSAEAVNQMVDTFTAFAGQSPDANQLNTMKDGLVVAQAYAEYPTTDALNPSKIDVNYTRSDAIPPNSSLYITTHPGIYFLIPNGFSFTREYAQGLADRSSNLNVAGQRALAALGHGGLFDFQRDPSNHVLYSDYVKGTNYGVGVYLSGAGFSLASTVAGSVAFALVYSNTGGLTSDNLRLWALGWHDASKNLLH